MESGRRSWPVALGLFLCLGIAAIGYAATSNPPSSGRVAMRGQWFIDAGDHGNLRLSLRRVVLNRSEHFSQVDLARERLSGLSDKDLNDGTHPVAFSVHRDAGTIECHGEMNGGTGAGMFELTLDPAYAAELERRGAGTPTEAQQAHLAMADVGYDLLDELHTQHYPGPRVTALVTMADHGVSFEYVHALGSLGYRLGSLTDLIQARDHGVDPAFIKGLQNAGYKDVAFADLLRARDHGVDPAFLGAYRSLGYTKLSLDELITLRDHGVDAEYLYGMRDKGFGKASLESLLEARDHGVTPEYVSLMADAGYGKLTLRQLVEARDHGVDPGYVSGMAGAGFKDVSLPHLITARDHGVDPAFARRVRSKQRDATLEEVIALRDRGW